ncbi:hypothetical protein EIP91_007370 [Steccherinum ochraceum]|uniref:Uncharacterized protein n=1 Tax=Steccherinum ochraceum TaxID=92696 RepID=A0A4R0RVF4_9APHY|nr:hypothetical protein EIP91_007370 [Steccherinum ochraceum]
MRLSILVASLAALTVTSALPASTIMGSRGITESSNLALREVAVDLSARDLSSLWSRTVPESPSPAVPAQAAVPAYDQPRILP